MEKMLSRSDRVLASLALPPGVTPDDLLLDMIAECPQRDPLDPLHTLVKGQPFRCDSATARWRVSRKMARLAPKPAPESQPVETTQPTAKEASAAPAKRQDARPGKSKDKRR